MTTPRSDEAVPAGSHSGLGRDNATRHLPRNAPAGGNPASPHNPKELSASARSRSDSRRTGQNRLTWQRCARRRRTRQRTLPSIAPSHVSQWSTHRHRRTRRSTHRHRRTRRSTHRHRRTHRSTHRHRRTRPEHPPAPAHPPEGPGKANGTPAMSATGALAGLHTSAATGPPALPTAGGTGEAAVARRRCMQA